MIRGRQERRLMGFGGVWGAGRRAQGRDLGLAGYGEGDEKRRREIKRR